MGGEGIPQGGSYRSEGEACRGSGEGNKEVGRVVMSRVTKERGSWLDETGRAVNKVFAQFVYKQQLD